MSAVVAPVFQAYALPPEAVSVVELPLHIVVLPEIVTVGVELTITETVAVLEHPAAVPVTV